MTELANPAPHENKELFIATPAYGGMLTVQYMTSLLRTLQALDHWKLSWVTYFIENESLIQRARNKCASLAMVRKAKRLLFIDADISWTPEDIKRLLEANVPVIAGTYPKKCLPIALNFNPLGSELKEFFGSKADRSVETYEKFRKECRDIDQNGVIQAMHVPTGFMMIQLQVLEKLKDKVPSYTNQDGSEPQRCWEFFPVRVRNDILESEDWAFCSLCRDHGIPVYFHTDVITNHTGTYTFDWKRSPGAPPPAP